MADISTINGVPIANVASVNGVPIANIATINGQDVPVAGTPPNPPTDLILSTP